MALDKNQILELLGQGLTPGVVASAVGCEPSYISQLIADEDFSSKIVAQRAKNLQAVNVRDRSIDTIEDKLLAKLEQTIDDNLLYKPRDILYAASVVNNMKRRGVPAHEAVTINNSIVNLSLPTQVINSFTINHQGEVVSAGEQSLVTVPAHTLLKSLIERGKENGSKPEDYARVQRFLPAAIEHGISQVRDASSDGREDLSAQEDGQR